MDRQWASGSPPPSLRPPSPQELYGKLGRSSSREAAAELSFRERMEAASRLAAMLQDASARWGLGGTAPEVQQPRRLDTRPGGGAAQQAVYARMSGGRAVALLTSSPPGSRDWFMGSQRGFLCCACCIPLHAGACCLCTASPFLLSLLLLLQPS